MKTKLMISALLFCSSLALAADLTSAPAPTEPKKKMSKPAPTSDKAKQVDETVLGTGLGGLGTGGASTAPTKVMRGRGTAPRK